MSVVAGVFIKCDRCGKEVFTDCEKASDDGNPCAEAMVRYATKEMTEWLFTNGAKHAPRKYSLCPQCKAEYLRLLSDFFGTDVEGSD